MLPIVAVRAARRVINHKDPPTAADKVGCVVDDPPGGFFQSFLLSWNHRACGWVRACVHLERKPWPGAARTGAIAIKFGIYNPPWEYGLDPRESVRGSASNAMGRGL